MRAPKPPTITEDQYIQNFFQWAIPGQNVELNYWHDIIRAAYPGGQSSLVVSVQELGRTLFDSADYAARNTSNHDYVRDLYQTYLNRAPDEPAWTNWTNYLSQPGVTRENVRLGFEYSTELYNLMGTVTMGGAPSASVSSVVSARVDEQNQPVSGLLGRSLDWSVPIVSLPGRAGLDLGISLSYSSQVWTRSGPYVYFDEDNGFPSPGFRLGFPTIQWQSFDAQVGKKTYVMITGSGRRVELRQVAAYPWNYEAADSSYLLLVDYGSAVVVTGDDGTQMTYNAYNNEWRCTQVKDTNGNYLSASYNSVGHITSVTDTLGRVITFTYDSNANLQSITQSWAGQAHTWANFSWGNRTVSLNAMSGLKLVGTKNGTSLPVVTQVTLADNSHFGFDYSGNLQVNAIRHADNDTVERAYTGYTYDAPSMDCPRLTAVSVSATNWTGLNGVPTSVTTSYGLDGSLHTMTAPDGTIYKEGYGTGWQKGLVTQTQIVSGGQVQKSTTTTYTQDNVNVLYPTNPRVVETIISDLANNQRRTTIDYVSSGLPTGSTMNLPSDVKEYVGNSAIVYRRTHTDYVGSGDYINRHILRLPQYQMLYDGGNSLFSKVGYQYDWNSEYLVNTSATPTQHDANYGTSFAAGRANLSRVMQFDVTDQNNEAKGHAKKMAYDINGSVVFNRDALDHQNSVAYGDNFSDSVNRNTFAYPTTLTDADGFSSFVKYNFDFGATTQTQGPPPQGQSQGAIQTTTYDSIGRVERTTTTNTGAYTRYIYGPTYVQSLSTVNNVADEAYSIQNFDGFGRVISTASNHPGSTGGYKAQLTIYNQMGRAIKASNPTEIWSNWIPSGDD
ncbi:MAG TPA: DUF4214 domain-containing protein, partial [Pyrinomonadaceae bacterium]|nr:DUF4214 domain-containing protein [Pyrinomonadaceae bacterium]